MENFFTRRLPELDPASTLAPTDLVLVNQADTTRKATIAQVRATLATEANLNSHTAATNNPHSVTASQVGAFTTQQTTTAITAAQNTVQTNLNTHTSNTSNPHATSASQVGAYTTSQVDTAVGAVATNLTAHTSNTSNPHTVTPAQIGSYSSAQTDTAINTAVVAHSSLTNNPHAVTHTQVGSSTAQWNANRLRGKVINTFPGSPPAGSIISYNTAGAGTFDLIPFPGVSLDSPAFTGNPTAPTPSFADSTTKLATMQAVTNNATAGFFYAERSAATALSTTTLISLTTNWSVKHGAGAFSAGVWTCPTTGWYHCDVYAKFDRTGGSTFTRAYADMVTNADVTIAPMFDFAPALNATAQGRASALVYLTAGTGYKMRVLITANGTTNITDGSLSFRWAGLNGLGATE